MLSWRSKETNVECRRVVGGKTSPEAATSQRVVRRLAPARPVKAHGATASGGTRLGCLSVHIEWCHATAHDAQSRGVIGPRMMRSYTACLPREPAREES